MFQKCARFKLSAIVKMYFLYPFMLANLVGAQNPSSPCPAIFQYQYDGDQWYGRIQLLNPPRTDEIKVQISMALRVHLTNKYYGAIKLIGGRDSAITSLNSGEGISYQVDFPVQAPLPRPMMIVVNNRVLCRAPPEPGSLMQVKLEHLLYTKRNSNVQLFDERNGFPTTKPTLKPRRFPSRLQSRFTDDEIPSISAQRRTTGQLVTRPSVKVVPSFRPRPSTMAPPIQRNQKADEPSCGRPLASANSLVMGGQTNERGRQPWLVAFYSQLAGSLQFRCGATLVSKNLVITAAHCIYDNHLQRSLKNEEVVLFLGKFNINSWSETDYQAHDVSKLIIHEDFKARSEASYDADIGLMVLKKPATFNQFVRPICLWAGSADLNKISGQSGLVTGWGRASENENTVSTPRTISVPIVPNKVCLAENESFRYLTSSRTFCAGGKDGRGPCNGDSGGGLVINRGGQFYFRGIVSASLRDQKTGLCNLNSYVVFTDVAMFSAWIRPHL